MAVTEIKSSTLAGLTTTEVENRRRQGEGNDVQLPTSRSYGTIIRRNIFDPIYIVIYIIGVALITLGRADDAIVVVGTIVFVAGVGAIQEIRAKRQLDAIALLARPTIQVIRNDGKEESVSPEDLVKDDLIVVKAGDQIVVDGELIGDSRLEVDESQLTGESDAIIKQAGDVIYSGSICLSGRGIYQATAVGNKTVAFKLSSEARQFRVEHSPLQRDLNFLIRLMALVAGLFGLLLVVSAFIYDTPAVRYAQAAAIITGLVPTGMFAMVIIAYSLGALRIARQGALVQQTNAVESLSNIDILCTDKTGTLTTNQIRYEDAIPFSGDKATLERAVATFSSSASSTNKTSEAIVEALGERKTPVVEEVAFSSARKWSALSFSEEHMTGAFVLGAPEVLQPHLTTTLDLALHLDEYVSAGMRVLLLAHDPTTTSLHDASDDPALPSALEPIGILTFSDELRQGLQQAIQSFYENGVTLKVISGDNPATVSALAIQAGLPGDVKAVSGIELDSLTDEAFHMIAQETTVFGRITPEQKARLVDSLRAQGHYVAMIGDGVNDVIALKKSNVGIAMQSGSAATRAVSDIVLLNDSFNVLPTAFHEGQRIVNGLRDTFMLFLSRSFTVIFIIVMVRMLALGFPFLPKHNAITSLLMASVPTFFLTLVARSGKANTVFLKSILRFSLPTALITALLGVLLYVQVFYLVNSGVLVIPFESAAIEAFQTYAGIDYPIDTPEAFTNEVALFFAQTVLTVYMVFTGAILILFVAPPLAFFSGAVVTRRDRRVILIAIGSVALFMVIMLIEPLRTFFELVPLSLETYITIIIFSTIWTFALWGYWTLQPLRRVLGRDFFRATGDTQQ